MIGTRAKLDYDNMIQTSTASASPAVSAVTMPSEETLESIGSEIEKRLESESGTIMKGFQEMGSRMDQDFAKSGIKTLHDIEESLKRHSQSLQQQFKAMTDQMRKGMNSMMHNDDPLGDMSMAGQGAPVSESGTNGTTSIFSAGFWRNVFSRGETQK